MTKDLPSSAIYAGVPARHIKSIDEYWDGLQSDIILTKKLTAKQKQKTLKAMYGIQQ